MLKKNVNNSIQFNYLKNFFIVNYIISYEVYLKELALKKEEELRQILEAQETNEEDNLQNLTTPEVEIGSESNPEISEIGEVSDKSEQEKISNLKTIEEVETLNIAQNTIRNNYIETHNFAFSYLETFITDFKFNTFEDEIEYACLQKTNLIKFYEFDLEFIIENSEIFTKDNFSEITKP